MVTALAAAAMLCAACTAGSHGTVDSSSSVSQAGLTAEQMCQATASQSQTVAAAYLTTVSQVRHRTGGPANTSPADKSWSDLSDDAPAAWCSLKGAFGYEIVATTHGGSAVVFVSSKDMIDPGSEGPAIP